MIDESLLQDFLAETSEHLEEIEKDLLKLSSGQEDSESLNDIFRSIHTIKGSSEYLGMVRIAELSHKMENILDKMRQKAMVIDEKVIDLLISGADRIALLIDELNQKGVEESGISDLLKKIEELENNGNTISKLTESPSNATISMNISPQQDQSITAPYVNVTYEEDYDIELFDIFVKQLCNGLKFLINRAQNFSSGVFMPEHLDECLKKIKSLQSSANYMGYEELVDFYQQWSAELNKKSDFDFHLAMNNINSIVAMFPKVGVLNELVRKGFKHLTEGSDENLSTQKDNYGPKLDNMLPNEDMLSFEATKKVLVRKEKSKESAIAEEDNTIENNSVNDSLLQDFIIETGEQLNEIESNLLRLPSDSNNSEMLNDIFRSIHTIKGSSEYLGMVRIAELSHKMENILDKMRQKAMRIDDEVIEILISGTDRIALLLNELNQKGGEESGILDLFQKIEDLENSDNKTFGQNDSTLVVKALENVVSQKDESITVPYVTITYEEDYDTELFEIFVEQLREGLELLKNKAQSFLNGNFESVIIEECLKKIKSLQSSANYMGYEKLAELYEQWSVEIDQKSDFDPHLVMSGISRVVSMFPKIEVLDELVHNGLEYLPKKSDENLFLIEKSVEDENLVSAVDEDNSIVNNLVDDSLLQDFIIETGEQLNEIENNLLRLSSDSDNSEMFNDIFRSVHTIKGSSEYLGMERIAQLSHCMENMLERMRSKEIVINEILVETLIEGRDRIRILIEEISEYRIERSKINDIICKLNELYEVNTKKNYSKSSSQSEIVGNGKTYQSENSVVYEEDTDAELFDIFIEQTKEGLNYLKKRFLTIYRNSYKESSLEECFDKLESLKKSAHYMSYDCLANVYTEWIEELKEYVKNRNVKNIGISILDHYVVKIKIIAMMFPKTNVFEDLIFIKNDSQTEIDQVENNEDLDGKYSIELNNKCDVNKVELSKDDENYINLTDHIEIDEVKIEEIENKEFVNFSEKVTKGPISEASEVDEEALSDVMDLENITSPEASEVDEEALSDVMDLENIASSEEQENKLSIEETDDDDLIELSEIVSENYFGNDPEYSKRMDEFILKIENDIDIQIDSKDENIKEDHPKIKRTESPRFEQSDALEVIDSEINKLKTYQKTTDTEKDKNKKITIENVKTETTISSERPISDNNQGRYEIDDSYFNSSFPEDILASLHAEFDLSKAEHNIESTKAVATSDKKDLGKDDGKLSSTIDKVHKSEKLAERPLTQSVRVDAVKIDALINQVGEIVVNRAFFSQLYNDMRMFEYYLRQNENIEKRDLKQIKELTFRMNEATMSLSRMTNDLQEKVMRVRMLPISQLFNRYPRLVHDLVRGVNKKVKLDIIGEDTELDRIVIERISDPLVHIIRNSIDHGIETITERERSGKPTIGTLRLEAYHEGNHVVIKVIDDGKGIDIERIKKKALEKQLLAYDEIERMSDKELTSLIMQPGFSTAPEITRTSGRGVGMDVVKKNVEKLNGTLEVESIFGIQTQIQIKIPLTLAIIPALLVGVSDDLFTIPLSTVDETIRLNKNNIFKIEGIEVFHLRDETIPLLRLTEVFNIESKKETDKEFAVIVKTGDTQIGLVVDELIGREEVVIKPLEDYLQERTGFSGATILGDGGISLILDIYELIDLCKNKQARKNTMNSVL